MAQYIKQGNIFGRIGSGIGKGLAEQSVKEIERSRLTNGLKALGEQKNLSPFEQFTGLVGAAHEYPQVVQSGAELLKQQGIRNSLRGGAQNAQQASPVLKEDPRVALALQQIAPQNQQMQKQQLQQNENVPRESTEGSAIQPKNPLRPEVKTFQPPTPEEFESRLHDNWDRQPGLTYPEVYKKTEDDYTRLASQPEAERAEDERLRGVQKEIQTKFDDQLKKKLQKTAEGTFKDITGEMQVNLTRGLERDIAKNGLPIDEAVNKWTNKALDLAKAKTNLDKFANGQGALSSFLKQGETIDKLQNFQKIYKDADNLEEYYNTLKEKLGFSPQAAAQIAFPRSESVKKTINKVGDIPYFSQIKDSKKIAMDIEDSFTREDSLLAIAKNLKDKYQNFNEEAFFKQISDDQDRLSLSPLQKRELAEGVSDWTWNWGDTWFFPNGRGLNK